MSQEITTAQAAAIAPFQREQASILSEIYEAMGRGDDACRTALNARYDATIGKIVAVVGNDAPCSVVDADLAMHYSQCYRDECGSRPPSGFTRATAQAHLDWLRAASETDAPNAVPAGR